jgi:HEAT repeat protein
MSTTTTPPTPPVTPYPGLRPYQENEQTRFYGRKADAEALISKILHNRLTLLFAATGVGKSSLLQAAILPQLKAADGQPLEVVYHNDWVSPPMTALKQAIDKALQGQALVIVLDQFEEFFRYRHIHHRDSFMPFIDQLADLILAPDLRVSLVFSMREDFALELNAFKPHLPSLLFGNYYRLEKLDAAAAREAIVTPLEQAGYSYEPALLEQLLHDLLSRDLSRDAASLAQGVSADSVEPPYLQIVCSQLWELDKDAPNKTLRLATYQKAGGAKGLLENYVNYVLKRFADREKQVASKAFDHLISRRGTKMAYTAADLANLVNLKPAELGSVLDKLESARILRRQQRDQTVWYELYHDMFSGGIESWNTAWKNHMRLRRTVMATGASLLALAGIYFSVVAYLQASSKHLRLGTGNYDRVEVYTGTSKFPDPFGQQGYAYETTLSRNAMELDKRYPKRDVQDYASLGKELIGSQPADTRFSAYIDNGEYCQVSTLLGQVMPDSKPAPGCVSSKEVLVRQAKAVNQQKLPATPQGAAPTDMPEEADPLRDAALQSVSLLKTPWGLELLQQIASGTLLSQQYAGQPGTALNALTLPLAFDEAAWLAQAQANGLGGGDLNAFSDPRQLATLLKAFMHETGDAAKTAEAGTQRVADLLRDYALQYGDPAVLKAVVQTLDALPALYAHLESKDLAQRDTAFFLLMLLGDSRATEALPKLLATGGSDHTYLQNILNQGGELDEAQLLPVLANRSLQQEQRTSVAEAFGGMGTLTAVPALLERLNDTTEWETIRAAAARSLGKISDASTKPVLLALFNQLQERVEVRLAALDALVMMADKAAIPVLRERFADVQERSEIRAASASALALLEDRDSVPTLLAALQNPALELEINNVLIPALGMMGDNRAVPALLAHREHLSASLRPEFDLLLANFDDPRVRQVLAASSNPSLKGVKNQLDMGIYSLRISFMPVTEDKPSPIRWATLSEGLYGTLQSGLTPYVSGMIMGSREQKQALLTALNLSDVKQRHAALLTLALDETAHFTLRQRALAELSSNMSMIDGVGAEQLVATSKALLPLMQQGHPLIRRAAVTTLAYLQTDAAALGYVQDATLPLDTRDSALRHFVETVPRAEAIAALLAIAKDDTNPLHPTAFQLLGDKQAQEALPLLSSALQTLEQEYRDWRKLRDQRPADDTDSETFSQWQQTVKQAAPKHAYLAAHYGYALARINREQGIAALAHDLADVREGAGVGLVLAALTAPDILQALDVARDQRKTADPIFQQAAFRTLDRALQRLETEADAKALTQLESWQAAITARPAADAVKQRLAWTITMIKHYQTLDAEFKKTYGLKRVR